MKAVAYLKTTCGWSAGVREVLSRYNIDYEEKIINKIISNANAAPIVHNISCWLLAKPNRFIPQKHTDVNMMITIAAIYSLI